MPLLYSLTLQRAGAIIKAVTGNFQDSKVQQIAVSRGKYIEIFTPNLRAGRLQLVCCVEIFGVVRSMAAFRLTGSTTDLLVVGSDSGRITILQYDTKLNTLVKIHQETYGKTGVRRIIPGEYIALDPKGRAIMIAALEKQKFVYVLNRDASGRLTISSPLEAHKSKHLCFDCCGVDVGFENPVFASMEVSYEKAEKPLKDPTTEWQPPSKGLAFWEMDLGLNHVVKKCTLSIPQSSHYMLPVPAGSGEGASGIIMCCENFLVYKKPEHGDIVCAYPRRLETGAEKGIMVVCHATHKLKNFYFNLLQTEYGDLYKVEISQHDGVVTEIVVKYFDTIPVCASLGVLKNGCLFAASETGNHVLYQFLSLGDESEDASCTSLHPHGGKAIVAFKPRRLKNLVMVTEMPSLSPLTDMKLVDCFGAGVPQLYALCGRGPRSTVRMLRYGFNVEEVASNELPGRPIGVWAFKARTADALDSFIVISFADATLLLAVGETVEEVRDSPFQTDGPTRLMRTMEGSVWLQVHDTGIRLIQTIETGSFKANQWTAPQGKRIVAATANGRQIALAVTGGDVFVFDLDARMHVPVEAGRKNMGHEITALALPEIVPGRLRAEFLGVAGVDASVRILSLDRDKGYFKQLSVLALPQGTQTESICLTRLVSPATEGAPAGCSLSLLAGLESGVLLRAQVDPSSGQLTDQRLKFLGPRNIKVVPVTYQADTLEEDETQGAPGTASAGTGTTQQAVLALSTRPWLVYSDRGRVLCAPLHYSELSCVSSFATEQAQDGFVGCEGNDLKIFLVQARGEAFAQKVITECEFTPRRLVTLPPPPILMHDGTLQITQQDPTPERPMMVATIESDHNAYDLETKREIRDALKKIELTEKVETKEEESEDMETKEDVGDPQESQIGSFKAGAGKWGSMIRVINPALGLTVSAIPLDMDEAAISCCVCNFLEFPEQPCLVVGTVFAMTLRPRNVPMASVKVYAYDANYQLTLLHSTPVEEAPLSMAPYNGRLLIGVGSRLRLVGLGKRKLLKKCEFRSLPEACVWLRVIGDRIFVGDANENFLVVKYSQRDNRIRVLADATLPAWVSTGCLLDYHTLFGADKFDSVYCLRLPEDARKDELGEEAASLLRQETAYATGKSHKFLRLNNFHVGETVTAMEKTNLTPGGSELILYSTIMGAVGAFLPITTRDEVDFLQHLEMVMRDETPPLCGRDHLAYRSYYSPCKDVIDGDLCETFTTLTYDRQQVIASRLDKTPPEVLRKIEELRNRIL